MTGGKLLPFKRVQGTVEELSDRALVSAVAEGDQAALGALFDRFQRDVYRFVAHLVRNDVASAEDLAQTTFLEVKSLFLCECVKGEHRDSSSVIGQAAAA